MRLKGIIGVLISLVLLYFVFSSISFVDVKKIIFKFGFYLFLIGMMIYSISFVFRAWRWQHILSPITKISYNNSIFIIFIAYFFNSVLPARIGDFIRAYILSKGTDIKTLTSISTIVVDRMLDGLTLFLLLSIGMIGAGLKLDIDHRLLFIIFLTFLLFIFLLIFYTMGFNTVMRCVSPLRNIIPNFYTKLESFMKSIKTGGDIFSKGSNAHFILFFSSLMVWLVEALLFYFVLYFIGIRIGIYVLFILLALVNLGIMIPSAPGYLGTFEAAFMFVLVYFGIEKEIALSAALIIHTIWFVSTIFFGLISIKIMGLNLKETINLKH